LFTGQGLCAIFVAFKYVPLFPAAADRPRVVEALPKVIAASEVGDRFGRVEPRAVMRRPKPHKLLKERRDLARKRLMSNPLRA
jgi:hypothetical protein